MFLMKTILFSVLRRLLTQQPPNSMKPGLMVQDKVEQGLQNFSKNGGQLVDDGGSYFSGRSVVPEGIPRPA